MILVQHSLSATAFTGSYFSDLIPFFFHVRACSFKSSLFTCASNSEDGVRSERGPHKRTAMAETNAYRALPLRAAQRLELLLQPHVLQVRDRAAVAAQTAHEIRGWRHNRSPTREGAYLGGDWILSFFFRTRQYSSSSSPPHLVHTELGESPGTTDTRASELRSLRTPRSCWGSR